jgi:hypothetical protein
MIFPRYSSRRKVLRLSATFLTLLFFSVSCKKKNTSIGLDTLNNESLLNSVQVDTFSLETFTIEEDSVITDNPAYAVLGSYNDATFGDFNAEFYTQLRLSGVNPNFGDVITNPIAIDSVVLGLQYAGYYGDFSEQTVEVYEMSESIYLDSTYYAFTTKNCKSNNLVATGHEAFVPNPNGITVIGKDTVSTQLRIYLSNLLGQKLISEATSGSAFSSNENFLDYFKGLHVKVNNPGQSVGKGGIFYFNLEAPLSKLTIYYKQSGVANTYDLLINSQCADFNHVEINNTGKPIQSVIENPLNGQKQYYTQAFKSRAVVRIPGMKNLPQKAIIHKAELYLPVQFQTGSKYAPSNELSASIRIDNQLTGIGVFGLYDNYTKQYTVDIRNYLQALINEEVNTTELILSPRYFVNSAERVILNGVKTLNKKKPQLVVTYTKF